MQGPDISVMRERKKATKPKALHNLYSQTLKAARMPYNPHYNLGFPLVLRCALNYKQQWQKTPNQTREKQHRNDCWVQKGHLRPVHLFQCSCPTVSSSLTPSSIALVNLPTASHFCSLWHLEKAKTKSSLTDALC